MGRIPALLGSVAAVSLLAAAGLAWAGLVAHALAALFAGILLALAIALLLPPAPRSEAEKREERENWALNGWLWTTMAELDD